MSQDLIPQEQNVKNQVLPMPTAGGAQNQQGMQMRLPIDQGLISEVGLAEPRGPNPLFEIGHGFLYLVEIFIIFSIAKFTFDRIAKFNVKEELVVKDNLAFMISYVGFFIGIGIILFTVISGDTQNLYEFYQNQLAVNPDGALKTFLFTQISDLLIYSLMGISLLLFSRVILDKLILSDFSIHKELIEDQNSGTGMAILGIYVSSSIIISAALTGNEPGLLSPVVYFLVGQAFLVIFTKIYAYFLPFDIRKEIERDNVAVGTAFGCTLIAVAILLHKGLSGDFNDTSHFLMQFVTYSMSGLICFPIIRWFFNRFFLADLNLTHELTVDRNIGIGLLEGAFAILMALGIYFSF